MATLGKVWGYSHVEGAVWGDGMLPDLLWTALLSVTPYRQRVRLATALLRPWTGRPCPNRIVFVLIDSSTFFPTFFFFHLSHHYFSKGR